MQSVNPSLPEFKIFRLYRVTSPFSRPGNVPARKFRCKIFNYFIQFCPAFYRLTLMRSPCANLAFTRPAGEIKIGFLVWNYGCKSFNPDLFMNFRPKEAERHLM